MVFLAGSAIAHVVAFALLPGFLRDTAVPLAPLEVALVEPEPLPVVAPEPEPVKPVPRKPEPQRRAQPERASAKPQAAQPEQPAPVLALPAIQTPAESTFTVPAPRAQEPGPEQKSQGAGIAVTPPAVGAAYLRNPAPPYPAAARRNGVQGTVMLKVVVTSEGLPARVEVDKSSGSFHLDNAALEAVKVWRFTPARRGAEPIEGVVTFPIVFRLESAS